MDHDYWPPNPSKNNGDGSDKSSNKKSSSHLAFSNNTDVSDKAGADLIASTSKEPQKVLLPDGNVVNIQVHNMLCNYTLPMHIDLRMVAYHSINVNYDRVQGVLIKQLRTPPCLVKIFNSGKIVIIRCKSENDCRHAARSIGRMIQRSMDKLDQKIHIRNYRVSNILASCRMPFGVRIEELARKYRCQGAIYEPELMVGLEWVFKEPKANLRIHTTGTVTITGATSENDLVTSIQKIYPFLKEFSCQKKDNNNKNLEEDDDEFFLESAKPRKRPCVRATASQSQPKNGSTNGNRGAKKQRIERTGIYNKQLYFSDEEEEGDEEYALAGEDFDEDAASDEDDE